MAKKIFITAGELSGDLNASLLVSEVRRIDPEIDFFGIGGPRMAAAGVRLIADSTTWGSMGIFEGIRKFPRIYPTARRIPGILRRERPDLYVPVDYRVFSIKCARIAKMLGINVAYYFSPISWFGTGSKRFRQMQDIIDLALVALPFSLDQYRDAGINFEYIGHPLVDAVHPALSRAEAFDLYGLPDSGEPLIGLMPGSRTQEIMRLTPVFADAAQIIRKSLPGSRFLLFRSSETFDTLIRKRLGDAPVTIVSRNVYDFMNICDVLILCSGTATHEAALMDKPMVITYKVSAAVAWLVRKTLNPPMAGLPNIIAGEFIVPELMQEACTPDTVARETLRLLTDPAAAATAREKLALVAAKLGAPGVVSRAADRIIRAANGDFSPRIIP